jgi:NTP pyrophosphatase (non-canonical NTP hydrolase)
MDSSFGRLSKRVLDFAIERDWGKFHTPRNLATALIVEAAELLEHFQWATDAEIPAVVQAKREELEQEIADVFIYLLRLSQVLQIDLIEATGRKVDLNIERYPADRVRGSAKKYSDYDHDN